ncbi:hypothetical protein Pan258_16120 [Symmachiella dynata]|nr:hypothetical protein Pan258_16120 [Symmachiella dynata]
MGVGFRQVLPGAVTLCRADRVVYDGAPCLIDQSSANIPPDLDFANNQAEFCVDSLNTRPDSNGDLKLGIK